MLQEWKKTWTIIICAIVKDVYYILRCNSFGDTIDLKIGTTKKNRGKVHKVWIDKDVLFVNLCFNIFLFFICFGAINGNIVCATRHSVDSCFFKNFVLSTTK